MTTKKKVNHLNVFLIKKQFAAIDDVVDASKCQSVVKIPISGHGNGTLFIKEMPALPPKWTSLFKAHINPATLTAKGISAAFALKIGERFFVLTFGHGRSLLRNDVWEEGLDSSAH